VEGSLNQFRFHVQQTQSTAATLRIFQVVRQMIFILVCFW